MEQKKNPQESQGEKPEEGKRGEINLDEILLPNKQVHDPTNASRANAGALFEQEQKAASAEHSSQRSSDLPATAEGSGSGARPFASGVTPAQPQEESVVKALETYQGDIESLVQKKNLSVVSIAAKEAARRGAQPLAEENLKLSPFPIRQIAMVLGGTLLIFGAVGLLTLLFLRTQPVPVTPAGTPPPFISVDATRAIIFSERNFLRSIVLPELEEAKQNSTLELGLIERIVPALSTTTPGGGERAVEARQLVSTFSLNVPAELLRALRPEYLLGIHSFDGNQPLLLLSVDSYQQAYAGMLAWEQFMRSELTPLFTRTPRPRTPEELATTATTAVQFLSTGFSDAVMENRDTRAVYNQAGDVLLLWTFLDQNTVVITTNEYTLREVLTRFTSATGSVK